MLLAQAAFSNVAYYYRVIQGVLLAQKIVLHINSDEATLDRNALLALSHAKRDKNFYITTNQMAWSGLHLIQAALESNGNRSITDCLRLSVDASSSDPRDKIFGVHSLLPSGTREFLPVDYSLDYEQMFGLALMLCIVECGHLNLLVHASLPRTSNIYSACTFGREEFREFLLLGRDHMVGVEDSSYFCIGKGNRPWKPRVSVKMISSTTQRLDTVIPGREAMASVVQQASDQMPLQQFLPRLKVRAHLLDISCKFRGSKGHTKDMMEDIYLHMSLADDDVSSSNIEIRKYLWLGSLFQLPRDRVFSGETVQQAFWPKRSIFNQSDFEQFKMEVDSMPLSTMFRTRYTVGFSASNHIAGDHVFAIDGVPIPFLLRQVGPAMFRIVGQCYLWAARELDYWSPGTHKGLWLERPSDLGEGTRMIEIY
jgi:hypothetical protein